MSIRDVLRSFSIPWKENGESSLVSSGWVGLECPRCGKGTGKCGLGIHVNSLATNCWKCGRFNLVEALSLISDQTFGDIRALLDDLAPEPTQALTKGKLEIPAHCTDLLPCHRKYLQGRGFDPDEIAQKWGVAGIGPNGGLYKFRLFIPVHNVRGKVVSWTTRAIGCVRHGERYRGASRAQSEVPRGELLYGEQHVRHAAICCEGPFDAMRIGYGAVATAGVGYSRAQILKLSKIPVRCVCFDREPAAQKRARDLAKQLAAFPGETTVIQLSGKDPADSPLEEIRELRRLVLGD